MSAYLAGMSVSTVTGFALLFSVALASVWRRKLTVPAAICGCFIGIIVFLGVGWTGIALMGCFFLIGVWATAHHVSRKELMGMAERNRGQRSASQVLANSWFAGLLGLVAVCRPEWTADCSLLMAGGFASAAADTVSSELGVVYGKRFVDIISLRSGRRGADGVVSLEGTVAGIVAAACPALLYALFTTQFVFVPAIILAGAIGNVADSVLGATAERRGWMGNDAVNAINTATGVIVTGLLCLWN